MPAFIATDHEPTGTRIRDVLSFGGLECPLANIVAVDEAPRRIGRETAVDLIVVNLPADRERGLALLPTLSRMAPGKVLAVGPTGDAKLVLKALRAGADDYLDVADLEIELEAAVGRLAAAAAGPAEPGRLIVVLGPSGGCGASTLAVNLAVALTKVHKDVGLLDLKLAAGDLAALLDLQPTFTLADLCQNAARLDRVMFERSLVKHDCGVHLLAPPQHLADVSRVRPDGVELAVTLARASFSLVVADLDHTFGPEQLIVLKQAGTILLTIRLDFTSLRNARRTLEHLERCEIAKDKVCLVVSRHGQPQEVPHGKVEEALGLKIGHFIPEDAKAINRANNHGVPVVLEAPSARSSKAFTQVAQTFDRRAARAN